MLASDDMSSINLTNEDDCVVISDEDDDDLAVSTKVSGKSTSSDDFISKGGHEKTATSFLGIRSFISSMSESDGRRTSRRRKNKGDIIEVIKEGEPAAKVMVTDTATTTAAATAATATATATNDSGTSLLDKKLMENRAETRSRKRERSGSPTPQPPATETKENEPIPFKEILTGLEGAAFQSRYGRMVPCCRGSVSHCLCNFCLFLSV